jgi:cytidylate kinase
MIVTIGGSVGSGKSTLAQKIAKRFGMKYVSAGAVMREMAKERGMSLIEYSKYAESDSKVDREIDKRQKELAGDKCVADGRLSAYLLCADLRIWLDAPLPVRAKRVAKRENISEAEAEKQITTREKSERKRYKEIYGIDLDDRKIYDLVINNEKFDADTTLEMISAAVKVFNVV